MDRTDHKDQKEALVQEPNQFIFCSDELHLTTKGSESPVHDGEIFTVQRGIPRNVVVYQRTRTWAERKISSPGSGSADATATPGRSPRTREDRGRPHGGPFVGSSAQRRVLGPRISGAPPCLGWIGFFMIDRQQVSRLKKCLRSSLPAGGKHWPVYITVGDLARCVLGCVTSDLLDLRRLSEF